MYCQVTTKPDDNRHLVIINNPKIVPKNTKVHGDYTEMVLHAASASFMQDRSRAIPLPATVAQQQWTI